MCHLVAGTVLCLSWKVLFISLLVLECQAFCSEWWCFHHCFNPALDVVLFHLRLSTMSSAWILNIGSCELQTTYELNKNLNRLIQFCALVHQLLEFNFEFGNLTYHHPKGYQLWLVSHMYLPIAGTSSIPNSSRGESSVLLSSKFLFILKWLSRWFF